MLNEVLTIVATKTIGDSAYIGFSEIPKDGSNGGWMFTVANFRPLITLEDDLKAHFTALLDASAPHGVDA